MCWAFEGREGSTMSLTLPSHFGSHSLLSHSDMHLNGYVYRMWALEEENVRETWGRMNVPHVPSALYTSAFERFYVSMWGTFSIPWFSVSKLLENRNHLWFASATCGRPFRFLLATRPHVAEGASASFGACLCFLRATCLKPSDTPDFTLFSI